VKQAPLCILSLDFQEAYDRISYQYLFAILRSHGFSNWFIERIKGMYGEAVSSVQINGHIAGPITIHCSIRQGYPMSMMLYAMCVDPLFRIVEQKLTGIRIGKRGRKTVVVAYADDITIFVTTSTDIPVIQEAIDCYEKAKGARLNTRKSRELAVGGWNTNMNVLNIPYQTEIKIFGVTFTSTVEQSMNKSWVIVTGKVRAQATETYRWDLCFSQCIRYVQTYLLTKIWTRPRCSRPPRRVRYSYRLTSRGIYGREQHSGCSCQNYRDQMGKGVGFCLTSRLNVKPSYADYGYKVEERGQQQRNGFKSGT